MTGLRDARYVTRFRTRAPGAQRCRIGHGPVTRQGRGATGRGDLFVRLGDLRAAGGLTGVATPSYQVPGLGVAESTAVYGSARRLMDQSVWSVPSLASRARMMAWTRWVTTSLAKMLEA